MTAIQFEMNESFRLTNHPSHQFLLTQFMREQDNAAIQLCMIGDLITMHPGAFADDKLRFFLGTTLTCPEREFELRYIGEQGMQINRRYNKRGFHCGIMNDSDLRAVNAKLWAFAYRDRMGDMHAVFRTGHYVARAIVENNNRSRYTKVQAKQRFF